VIESFFKGISQKTTRERNPELERKYGKRMASLSA